ncbi:bifunctional adenosylcobinamide kinase/adenosylcobinamide-phosphate guanylyltransferase [bacterium]|nr:MAG: bifunctional adenosylcobinamide kinase/adenosylcobinamide-phosphate guanylyltransferase [bacterium]
MCKITFILGGARSGKSRFAVSLAKKKAGKVAFIATCKPLDSEMKRRVALHKKLRPLHWKTFEETNDIPRLLRKIGSKFEIIIIDCLTLLASNFMLQGLKEEAIKNRMNKMLSALTTIKAKSIVVSNEVGSGIVPGNKLSRDFRDIAGRINQMIAEESNEVFFLVSGIPWRIKCKK